MASKNQNLCNSNILAFYRVAHPWILRNAAEKEQLVGVLPSKVVSLPSTFIKKGLRWFPMKYTIFVGT